MDSWKVTNILPDTGVEDIESLFQATFQELFELMVKKQKAYGPGNIEAFGPIGVLVRLSDKLARLKTLMAKGENPDWESLEDTWMDVANYGVIGLLLMRDQVFHPREKYRLVKES